MYAPLREYEGIKDPAQATQPLLDGLLAEMQALPGFIAYYFLNVGEAGDRMISLSVFESSEAAEESNRVEEGWVARLANGAPTKCTHEESRVCRSCDG
jgi:heme-degrading monooxygenase HmoA